jgi:hypothetical protein
LEVEVTTVAVTLVEVMVAVAVVVVASKHHFSVNEVRACFAKLKRLV